MQDTPNSHIDSTRAESLIRSFEDPDIEVRDRAFAELRKMLPAVAPLLRKYLNHPDAEVQGRCRDLLNPSVAKVLLAAGKVALVDENRGRIATDIRSRDGAQKSQRLDIMRHGKKIGTVIIEDVQAWGSWAKPADGTKIESIQRGDIVDSPKE